jgi:HSP20 family protein
MLLRTDVFEEDDELVVEIDAPGVDASKLEVRVADDTISIEGAPSGESRIPGRVYHRRERQPGAFQRQIPLPLPVCRRVADALLEDGVLRIRIPLARRDRRDWDPVFVDGVRAGKGFPD